MKNLVSLLVIVTLLISACSSDSDNPVVNSKIINPNIQKEINDAVAQVKAVDKKIYLSKLNALISRCNEPDISIHSNPYVYQDNEEYVAYKNFIIESPQRYYLLIDTYLRNEVGGWFHWMFTDIVDARYPGLCDKSYEEAKGITLEEKYDAFASVCITNLLEELAK